MQTKLKIQQPRPGDAYEILTAETPSRLVAAVFHRDGNPYRVTRNEAEAYAILFVAARDLLEACKELIAFDAEYDEDEGYDFERYGGCLQTICAAVAKAEAKGV